MCVVYIYIFFFLRTNFLKYVCVCVCGSLVADSLFEGCVCVCVCERVCVCVCVRVCRCSLVLQREERVWCVHKGDGVFIFAELSFLRKYFSLESPVSLKKEEV